MHNNSFLELDAGAYRHNLKFLKAHFNPGVIFSSVVKGNAYGHSIEVFVPIALKSKINHFSVFDINEAKRVKAIVGDKATVMIMGWMEYSDLDWVIENDVEFFVFEKRRLSEALSVSKKKGKKSKIHIELETGMNRTGFHEKEITRLIQTLEQHHEYIELKGLCTHFAGAESIANYYRIQKQIEQYNKLYQLFCAKGLKPELRHTACSAAAMMFPETQMDMVRIGIMQYGFWPSTEVMVSYFNKRRKKVDPLKRMISWKTSVMSLKRIKRGEFIGYGTSFMADANMKVAVIPIGYAHGYSRSLSNVGRVLINGERCVVVGSVNMNMMLVDVSFLPKVKIGDEVVLIGYQGKLSISVASFGDYSNLLNYELLTRISQDIPRKLGE